MKNLLINTLFLLFLASFVNCQGSRQLIRENEKKMHKNDFNIYKAHSGFSIETQYMPNDINMYGAKAQSILEADTLFTSKTSFQIHEK